MNSKFHFLTIILLLLQLTSCRNANSDVKNFTIDPNIAKVSKQKIQIDSPYNNKYFNAEVNYKKYANDSIIVNESKIQEISGTYFWINDTLIIRESLNSFAPLGIIVCLSGEKLISYKYFEGSHVQRKHKLNIEDTLSQIVKVPCSKYDLTISNIPKQNSNDTIYGFVEHFTFPYYFQTIDSLMQLRNGLKFYFKATKEGLKPPTPSKLFL